jgi:hypothetical protein
VSGCLNTGRDALYRQGNNVMEVLDGPALTKCNDTAIVMAWAAVTPKFDEWKNPFGGTERWQPEDLIDLYFHNEKNWPYFKTIRKLALCHGQPHNNKWPPEQIPQYHQAALKDVLGCGADFSFNATFTHVAGTVNRKISCILRLKDPGHFVTAVDYKEKEMLIGFKDPAPVKWLQSTEDVNGNKWMSLNDFIDNIHSDITRCWRL